MKLWHISQSKNNGYDTYSDAVVSAETEEEAKNMHPGSGDSLKDDAWCCSDWVRDASDVHCVYLGEAVSSDAGIICSSFHAG